MIKTNIELVEAAENAAKNYRTLYVRGCFGAPMNDANKKRYTSNHVFNTALGRKSKIMAASADTFGFDCVCFIKGLLWDWVGDPSQQYGGAKYQSNGVPDIGANSMIKVCQDVSTDFSNIQPGEAVWITGHIGLYIGNGLAVECTYRWADGVQITAVHNIGKIDGYNGRKWTKHGKLPWIEYVVEPKEEPVAPKELEVNDIVNFIGNTQYNSEDATSGKKCKSGQAQITKIVKGAKHPYHLVRTGSSGPWGWVNTVDIAEANVPVEPEKPWVPAVGDVVNFTGNTQYNSEDAASGRACSAGTAKITKIVKGQKHPYHLVRTGKTGPWGWVDAGTFTKA